MSHLFASNAAFEKNNIPVFYATDENYAPYLYVSIKSLISHISSEYNYDICILIENLSDRYKKLITSLALLIMSLSAFLTLEVCLMPSAR